MTGVGNLPRARRIGPRDDASLRRAQAAHRDGRPRVGRRASPRRPARVQRFYDGNGNSGEVRHNLPQDRSASWSPRCRDRLEKRRDAATGDGASLPTTGRQSRREIDPRLDQVTYTIRRARSPDDENGPPRPRYAAAGTSVYFTSVTRVGNRRGSTSQRQLVIHVYDTVEPAAGVTRPSLVCSRVSLTTRTAMF